MTRLTEDEQWDRDLDWFGVDSKGRIGHFTTGGFRLTPGSVAESEEDRKEALCYFKNLPDDPDSALICPGLEVIKQFETPEKQERFLKCYMNMASRGLYSFDSFDYTHPERQRRPYFRIAIPKKELLYEDLPPQLMSILGRTLLLDADFATDTLIRTHEIE